MKSKPGDFGRIDEVFQYFNFREFIQDVFHASEGIGFVVYDDGGYFRGVIYSNIFFGQFENDKNYFLTIFLSW